LHTKGYVLMAIGYGLRIRGMVIDPV
jgi:hypothetical protein